MRSAYPNGCVSYTSELITHFRAFALGDCTKIEANPNDWIPPHWSMSTTRPKLRLDEQSFQDLLAAAFTIQEHNARRKSAVAAQKPCPHCGAPLPKDQEMCAQCGSDRDGLRSGERLQRNWASMWMMSQGQQFQVPEEIALEDKIEEELELPAIDDIPQTQEVLEAHEPEKIETAEQFSVEGLRISEVIEELKRPAELEEEHPKEAEDLAVQQASVEEPHYAEEFGEADLVPVEGELVTTDATQLAPHKFEWNDLAFWKKPLKLRFDRADFYLGLSILIAAFVLVWAATSTSASGNNGAQRRPRLTFWEQALVDLGLAEAPDAPIYHGDPKVQVWVDPHTALYYCAGEEQYGKTPDGHYTTQHEAQMDQFEPSERSACE